jgi:TDG/mug DNA glycosylase family protein
VIDDHEPPAPTGDHTVEVYEQRAAEWASKRQPSALPQAQVLARRVSAADGPIADLGCGPGWHLAPLGRPCIALDAARSILDIVPDHAPEALRVQAELSRLPFAASSLGGALATNSYVHLDGRALPRALADLHRALAPGAPVSMSFFGSGPDAASPSDPSTTSTHDDFPGRRFSLWHRDHLADVATGAGFEVDEIALAGQGDGVPRVWVTGSRRRSLPDTVGPAMHVLVCGLNPSVRAADAGVGFVTPGNRFWPAAIDAGLVSLDRDPLHALDRHGVGMTDLVKRATRRADELDAAEYAAGLARVERLVSWLQPRVVCFVGLAGYRAAGHRKAQAGLQGNGIGGRPLYLMPSTSGLNAHSRLEDLTDHLREVRRLAG